MADGSTSNPENQSANPKQLADEIHWIHHATFWSQVGLGVIGLSALFIYGCQLKVMQGQLDEMKRSGEQSTQQMWSAIGNINWEARSADWSQKSTQQAMGNEVRQMDAQVLASKAIAQQSTIQAGETKRLADLAKSSNEQAMRNFETLSRPWVGLEGNVSVSRSQSANGADKLVLNYTLKNFGAYPALNTIMWLTLIP